MWGPTEVVTVLSAAAALVAAVAAATVQVIHALRDVGQKIDRHEEASAQRLVTMLKAEGPHDGPPPQWSYPKGERLDGEAE